MASNDNQYVLEEGNPGDVNPLIGRSVYHQIHIWHENKGGELLPYRKLTVERALSFIEDKQQPKTTVIDIDESKVSPYLGKFTSVFSWGGIYWPVSLKHLVVPTSIEHECEDYIRRYGLTEYRDLVWYLIARLQVFYTQKIAFGTTSGKAHMDMIREDREDYMAMERLVQYVLTGEEKGRKNPLSITITQGKISHTITAHWRLWFLMEGFVKMFLSENGKLLPHWKEKLASYDANYAIKDDFEHIHRNFAIAYMEFLKREHIVTDDKISAQYLNPVADLLNISQYPFINKDGDDVTPRHIRSVLKKVNYSLPTE